MRQVSHPANFFEVFISSVNELKMLLYGLFMYLNINTETIQILSWLMLIDTMFGATKALRINYKSFSFRFLMLGLATKLMFILLPLVIALIGKGLGYNFKFLVDISLKILVVSEGISIFSNAIAIRTKKEVKDFDLITRFLKYVRDYFLKIAETLLTTAKKEK